MEADGAGVAAGRLESLQLLHDSSEIAPEVGHADDLARAFQNLTYIQLFAGLADEALTAADAGLQLVRRLGTMLSSGIGIAEHQAEAVVRADRCDDMIYAPKACSVGISAEAACPAPDLGTVGALTTRLSGIEAMARSFDGRLLAEPAAFVAMARAEAGEFTGGPQPQAWQAATTAWDHCGDQY